MQVLNCTKELGHSKGRLNLPRERSTLAHGGVTGTSGSPDKAATYPKTAVGGPFLGFLSGWVGNRRAWGREVRTIPRVPCFSPGGQSSLILHQNPHQYYRAEGEERGQNSSNTVSCTMSMACHEGKTTEGRSPKHMGVQGTWTGGSSLGSQISCQRDDSQTLAEEPLTQKSPFPQFHSQALLLSPSRETQMATVGRDCGVITLRWG